MAAAPPKCKLPSLLLFPVRGQKTLQAGTGQERMDGLICVAITNPSNRSLISHSELRVQGPLYLSLFLSISISISISFSILSHDACKSTSGFSPLNQQTKPKHRDVIRDVDKNGINKQRQRPAENSLSLSAGPSQLLDLLATESVTKA